MLDTILVEVEIVNMGVGLVKDGWWKVGVLAAYLISGSFQEMLMHLTSLSSASSIVLYNTR